MVDVHHFVGVCQMLAEIRKTQFSVMHLTLEVFMDILNGSIWSKLIPYQIQILFKGSQDSLSKTGMQVSIYFNFRL